jgi:ubiquinone/menaquinone biosynthesis C-methylase UbiE
MKDKEMPIPNQDQTSNHYVIRGGKPGRDRLRILNRALRPTTLAFFERAGLGLGQRGLDLGCGGGALSRDMAFVVGREGRVTGLDMDAENIAHARREAEALGWPQLCFQVADILEWEGASGRYNFVYARFLLTHLPDPAALLRRVYAWLKPGGRILLEDIDFTGHFCYPVCKAFDDYVAWYTAVVELMGADPNIGPRLPLLVQKAGFRRMQFTVVQPVFQSGEGKQMSSLTLENIKESLIRNQLASNKEIDTSLTELRAFEEDRDTLVSLPRIFQVWAVK